jgi:putative transposase
MGYHQRRLPHWEVTGQPLFVTFRLHGSLPTHRLFPPARMTSGRAFVVMDRLLDQPTGDPLFLRWPEIARVVVQALQDGQLRFQRYQLHACVVMPNHVHLLVSPAVTTQQWLGPLKGFTAHQANWILGRHGPFWQDESYDHLIRDDREFQRVQRYIEQNPVRAGLVALPEEFAWSSAVPGRSPAAG